MILSSKEQFASVSSSFGLCTVKNSRKRNNYVVDERWQRES